MERGSLAEPTKPEPLKAGDTVVGKWAKNSFYEGTVESITDSKVKIKWPDGSSPSEIDKGDVFVIPKAGAKPDVTVGEMVLAKINPGTYWSGAEVTKVEGEVITVKGIDVDRTANLATDKVIKIPAPIAADLKEKSGSNDFLKLARSKKPTMPTDYTPKSGEQVLAEWATASWWQGKVQKVSGDKVTIAWEDGSKPSDVELKKVMPYPRSSDTQVPQPNQYVLVKPESGSKWIYAQVTSAETGAVQIKDAEGKSRTVKQGEFVLLN
ncbi:MAG: hypothetical protein AB7Q37_12650 [Pyrinomonadaceae bacterium]